METGPTQGASESATWRASKPIAIGIRVFVLVVPLLIAFVGVRVVADLLYRPPGTFGLVIWVIQAGVIGAAISRVAEMQTRQLLPLATLFGMSMAFPDQAPSRFGVALRTGTVKQLQSRLDEVRTHGLGDSESDAARTAIELVSALAKHDRLTRGHTERVRAFADLIGEELNLPEGDRLRLSWGVLLHDVGKLYVPSEILNKDGKPSDEEWAILKSHPERGRELLRPLEGWLGPWLLAASEHHERWDGNGYPLGLAGTQISLAGRIAAVADAYDVITSKRTYKAPLSAAAAKQELVDCAGSQFDPAIVRAFLNVSVGRRWTAGPLAWLADLPIGQLGTAATANTAAVALGSVAAVGTAAALPPVVEEPPPLAFTEVAETTTTTIEIQQPGTSTTLLVTTTVADLEDLPTTTLPATTTTTTTVVEAFAPPSSTTSTSTTSTSTLPPSTTTTTTIAPTTTTVFIENGYRFGGHTYARVAAGETIAEARATAEALGGHVLTISSDQENDFIRDLFGSGNPVWLGISDEAVEGTWTSFNGEPVNYTNWLSSQPDNAAGGNQHFAVMTGPNGKWDDRTPDQGGWFDGEWMSPPPVTLTVVEFDF